MEEERLSDILGRMLFYIYFVVFLIFGIIVCIMNLQVSISLKNEPDPNPGVAMYFEIIYLMIFALIISGVVSTYQYARYIKTFKLSLVPLIIWVLSFVLLFI
jgi:hypothetical protein